MTMMALTISVSLTSFFPKNPAERGQTTIPNLNEYADAKLMSPIFRRARQVVRTRCFADIILISVYPHAL